MIDQSEYIRILKRYLEGTISPKEHDELFSITSTEDVDSILSDLIETELNNNSFTGVDLPPHVSEEILRNILISEKNSTRILKSSGRKWKDWVMAASVFGLIILVAYFLISSNEPKSISEVEALVPKTNIEKTNSTASPLTVQLSDGSQVILKPHATINYPFQFISNKREVYLKGEAFFNVAKNTTRPFLVYYNNLVTQVLGTSFMVKTNPKTNNIEVTVKTGKVQVYENTNLLAQKDKVKGVILTQNQKAIYYTDQRAFETTLSDSLQPIITEAGNDRSKKDQGLEEFFYRKPTNLQAIFNQLQSIYGIEIVVENENLYNCLFTGDLSKPDVYKKLSIICQTVDAEFEIKGTRILISGKGCD